MFQLAPRCSLNAGTNVAGTVASVPATLVFIRLPSRDTVLGADCSRVTADSWSSTTSDCVGGVLLGIGLIDGHQLDPLIDLVERALDVEPRDGNASVTPATAWRGVPMCMTIAPPAEAGVGTRVWCRVRRGLQGAGGTSMWSS